MDPAANSAATITATWRPGVIDLGPGHPSTDLLPLELLRSAAQAALTGDASILQYGAEQGSERFRRQLAAVLAAETGVATDPDALFVTGGASQALDILCTLYARPGQTVLVAEPTYFLALRLFADRGLHVVPIQCDEHGPLPEALEAALALHRPALFYLVPIFGNPTGVTLTPERRAAVVDLTAGTGTLVVADEVYRLLQFDGQPTASLVGEGREHVVSLNSFSKTLGPGLRLGWFAGPEAVIGRVRASGFLRSGGGLNPVVAALVGELLADGRFSDHVRNLRRAYAQRAGALAAALREHVPELAFDEPRGGYFIWARLPGVGAERLRGLAREAGADFAPGAAFSAGGGFSDHLRLSFSRYAPEELTEGARRLGVGLRAALAG